MSYQIRNYTVFYLFSHHCAINTRGQVKNKTFKLTELNNRLEIDVSEITAEEKKRM